MISLVSTLLPPTLLGCFAAAAGVAAARDVISRTIPTACCAAIALLGLATRAADGTLLAGLAAATVVFALCLLCWRRGWLGGGDVKLLAACALAVPPHLVPALLVDTAMAGAVLALVYLIARNRVQRPQPATAPRRLLARALRVEQYRLSRGGPLPYGVAIAAAVIFILARGMPP